MKCIIPKDHNGVWAAPAGADNVFDVHGVNCRIPGGKGTAFYTLWVPSAEELALLVAGHPIMLGVLNNGQPPHPFIALVAAAKDRVVNQPLPGEEGFEGLQATPFGAAQSDATAGGEKIDAVGKYTETPDIAVPPTGPESIGDVIETVQGA